MTYQEKKDRAVALTFLIYNQHMGLCRARQSLSVFVQKYLDQTGGDEITLSAIRKGLPQIFRNSQVEVPESLELRARTIYIKTDCAAVGKNRAYSRNLRREGNGRYSENVRYDFGLPTSSTVLERKLTDGDILLALEFLGDKYQDRVDAPRVELDRCLEQTATVDLYDHSLLPYLSDALQIATLSIQESRGEFSHYSVQQDQANLVLTIIGDPQGNRIGDAARDFTPEFAEVMASRFDSLGVENLEYQIDHTTRITVDKQGVIASRRPGKDISSSRAITKTNMAAYAVNAHVEALCRKKATLDGNAPIKVALNCADDAYKYIL